jgi:uncharacterized Fe-S cluster-containing radical SAM superfamily protein
MSARVVRARHARGYDPVELAAETVPQVTDGERRRYYRFRPARFYGGIATADCVGCCLRCVFCWAWRQVAAPAAHGTLCSPAEVAGKIGAIARRHRFRRARLSGNEPTLARGHLVAVLGRLPAGLSFVLETNGILLGHDPGYARELAAFRGLGVRVSFKGCTPAEFSLLTGADPEAFRLPLAALENLLAAGVACHAAAMTSFSPPESVAALRERLHAIHPSLADLEEEEAFLNPGILARLHAAGFRRDPAP